MTPPGEGVDAGGPGDEGRRHGDRGLDLVGGPVPVETPEDAIHHRSECTHVARTGSIRSRTRTSSPGRWTEAVVVVVAAASTLPPTKFNFALLFNLLTLFDAIDAKRMNLKENDAEKYPTWARKRCKV